jgi:hypothetical protein
MEGVSGLGFGSLEGLYFGSLLTKLSTSLVSFESDEESLDNTITLLPIYDRKKPIYNS